MDWNKIREDFPVTREYAYFMSAALSPLPRQVSERVAAEYRKLSEAGDAF
jgi:selenocysteine lyase/cysteine desulfurase